MEVKAKIKPYEQQPEILKCCEANKSRFPKSDVGRIVLLDTSKTMTMPVKCPDCGITVSVNWVRVLDGIIQRWIPVGSAEQI